MKTSGELKSISLDYQTHRPEIVLSIDANAEDLEKLTGKKLSVELKQYREHRSLDANAYYWTLCGHIADAIGRSQNYTHNVLLRRYGQIEAIDGHPVYLVIPDTIDAANTADEAETFHIKPTSEVKAGTDGKMYRTYILLRGSHDYDTKEMSRLIDGTIDEAKQLGIETLTPDQQKEMIVAYEQSHKRRMENHSGI